MYTRLPGPGILLGIPDTPVGTLYVLLIHCTLYSTSIIINGLRNWIQMIFKKDAARQKK